MRFLVLFAAIAAQGLNAGEPAPVKAHWHNTAQYDDAGISGPQGEGVWVARKPAKPAAPPAAAARWIKVKAHLEFGSISVTEVTELGKAEAPDMRRLVINTYLLKIARATRFEVVSEEEPTLKRIVRIDRKGKYIEMSEKGDGDSREVYLLAQGEQ